MAKLFDGADEEEAETWRAKSKEGEGVRVHSPIPMRPFSPESPLAMGRRGAVYEGQDMGRSTGEVGSNEQDPFVETMVLTSPPLEEQFRRAVQIGIGAQKVVFTFPNWAAPAREKEKRDSLDVDEDIAPDDVGEQR